MGGRFAPTKKIILHPRPHFWSKCLNFCQKSPRLRHSPFWWVTEEDAQTSRASARFWLGISGAESDRVKEWFFWGQILLFCCRPDLSSKVQGNRQDETKTRDARIKGSSTFSSQLGCGCPMSVCSATELEWTIWPLPMLEWILDSCRTFKK